MTEDLFTPKHYWEQRYRLGRSSGAGSEGAEGRYKAAYLSEFIAENDVQSVVDWGCGDGQVLKQADLHGAQYIGIDISPTIIAKMRDKFAKLGPRYLFYTVDAFETGTRTQHDLALSFDVLFHFPDDTDYRQYLTNLFSSSSKFVMIYSTNYDLGRTAKHVYRRTFTTDVAQWFPEWSLSIIEMPLREGAASFFVYEKVLWLHSQ